MIRNRIFILTLLFFTISTTGYTKERLHGYNEICQIYTEAYNTNMSVNTLSQYILENIKKRVQSDDAIEAHIAIMHADPTTRYELFKNSAEHTLNRNWDCNAMKQIFKMRIEKTNALTN